MQFDISVIHRGNLLVYKVFSGDGITFFAIMTAENRKTVVDYSIPMSITLNWMDDHWVTDSISREVEKEVVLAVEYYLATVVQ